MKTVTIDGTKVSFHTAHQLLWNWLAENPGKTKEDYFILHDMSIIPDNRCFACGSCEVICNVCPVVRWRNLSNEYFEIFVCNCYDDQTGRIHYDLYGKWLRFMDGKRFDEACEIARQIADLEWEEVEK